MKRKKRYRVQWKYDQLRMWWTETRFRSKKRALKYTFKMLSRSSNAADWRIIEEVPEADSYYIIFESNTNRRKIGERCIKNFTAAETDEYNARLKKWEEEQDEKRSR